MELSPDFVMTPYPPIPDDAATRAAAERQGATALAAEASTPTATADPVGRLAGLVGSWKGSGLNIIWRPHNDAGQDRFLQINVTDETLDVERVPGAIPNRGFLQPDITMFGLHYLQQISDANLKGGLHFEPGIWAHVPRTSNPHEGVTVVRMASVPHGTTFTAQGPSSAADETPLPHIPVMNIKPFPVTNPSLPFDFPEQDLSQPTDFRTPKEGLVGVTQDMVDDPSSILRAAIRGQNITSTVRLQVTTRPDLVLGGGTANTAFLEGAPDPQHQDANANANAVTITSTFWLESLGGEAVPSQLQYVQTVLLNFNRLSWPHITVGTLRRVPPTT